jgi:hypothetical protein
MSEHITMQQFIDVLKDTNKPIFDKLGTLEAKIDTATANINSSLITNAVMEANLANHEKTNKEKHDEMLDSLSKNWDKTRKIDSKIIRWGGIVMGLSFASGAVFKYFL